MTPDTFGSQTHHHEVARPDPSDTRAYLEQLTKAVFIAGLNWKVVENKWPGFLEAFHGFDPRYVANLSPKQVEAIAENPAVIRNRSKIEATVDNANVMLELVKGRTRSRRATSFVASANETPAIQSSRGSRASSRSTRSPRIGTPSATSSLRCALPCGRVPSARTTRCQGRSCVCERICPTSRGASGSM